MSISENILKVNFIKLNKKTNPWESLSDENIISLSKISDLAIIIVRPIKKTFKIITSDSDLSLRFGQDYMNLRFRLNSLDNSLKESSSHYKLITIIFPSSFST